MDMARSITLFLHRHIYLEVLLRLNRGIYLVVESFLIVIRLLILVLVYNLIKINQKLLLLVY